MSPGCQVRLLQRGQQARDGMVGAAVDEGAATALDDEVRRVEMIALERSIDGVDAVQAHPQAYVGTDNPILVPAPRTHDPPLVERSIRGRHQPRASHQPRSGTASVSTNRKAP